MLLHLCVLNMLFRLFFAFQKESMAFLMKSSQGLCLLNYLIKYQNYKKIPLFMNIWMRQGGVIKSSGEGKKLCCFWPSKESYPKASKYYWRGSMFSFSICWSAWASNYYHTRIKEIAWLDCQGWLRLWSLPRRGCSCCGDVTDLQVVEYNNVIVLVMKQPKFRMKFKFLDFLVCF